MHSADGLRRPTPSHREICTAVPYRRRNASPSGLRVRPSCRILRWSGQWPATDRQVRPYAGNPRPAPVIYGTFPPHPSSVLRRATQPP